MAVDWDGLVLAPLHAAFGEAITYQSQSSGMFSLTDAVLDRAFMQVDMDSAGVPVTAWRTVMGIRLASCPAGFQPQDGDRLQARGSTYMVVDEQPDGKGHVMLVLGVAP